MTSTRTLTSALHLFLAIVFLALGSQSPLLAAAAPAWDLKDVKGKSVKLSDFKGKVVILDFWATWCPPCRAEIPHFIGLQEKYGKQGLVVVGVSVDEGGPDVVSSFVKANKINYPIVMGNLDVAQLYDANEGIPTTFVIDRTGNIVAKHLGFTDSEIFEKEIKSVL
jgi:cytochrome c biogenesis protein CcmG/thiol:disulfide interchange protein DsbE